MRHSCLESGDAEGVTNSTEIPDFCFLLAKHARSPDYNSDLFGDFNEACHGSFIAEVRDFLCTVENWNAKTLKLKTLR